MEVEKQRLIKEREMLADMRSEIKAPRPSQYSREVEWYVISSTWVRAWEIFVNSFTMSFPPPTLHPGPIDSTDIITSPQVQKVFVTYSGNPFNVLLKPKIVIKRDYYVASTEQWQYLAQTYGVVSLSELKRFGQTARSCKLYPKELKLVLISLSETEMEYTEEVWFRLHQDLTLDAVALELLKLKPTFDMLKSCESPADLAISSVSQEVFTICQTKTKDRNFRVEVLLRNCQIDPNMAIGKAVKPNNILAVRVTPREGADVLRNSVGTSTLLARTTEVRVEAEQSA